MGKHYPIAVLMQLVQVSPIPHHDRSKGQVVPLIFCHSEVSFSPASFPLFGASSVISVVYPLCFS
ncbi:hypothetical protein [Bartonella sp. CM92QHHN]|uniref:hypothetical protein n=1 Tax=Bartonella sp. CM92QHHN TaxID=3243548 RepID=UPI0035D0D398